MKVPIIHYALYINTAQHAVAAMPVGTTAYGFFLLHEAYVRDEETVTISTRSTVNYRSRKTSTLAPSISTLTIGGANLKQQVVAKPEQLIFSCGNSCHSSQRAQLYGGTTGSCNVSAVTVPQSVGIRIRRLGICKHRQRFYAPHALQH